jgi:hypothetical protein
MKASDWLSRENIEWAARLYKYLRSRPLTRYGGVLFVGALALYSNVFQMIIVGVFLVLGKQLTIPDAPAGVFYTMIAVGACLIILDRLLPEKAILPTAYPHDEQLLRTIRDAYTQQLDDFLRLHAFGNGSFKSDILNPLGRFRSWCGSQYEFINEEVNDAWNTFREAAHTLLREVGEKTVSVLGSINRITPFRDDEDVDWHTQEMIDRCKVLDVATDKVAAAWDKFDAVARRQIPNILLI